MPPGSNSGRRSGVDLEALLADAHRAVVGGLDTQAGARGAPDPEPVGTIHRGWLLACLTAWGLLAILLITPPGWLRAPAARPFTPVPGTEEASLRWGIWLAVHRVEAYRGLAGRLPGHLGETGFDDPAIALVTPESGRYRLFGQEGAVEVEFEEGMDLQAFLGSAVEQLAARR